MGTHAPEQELKTKQAGMHVTYNLTPLPLGWLREGDTPYVTRCDQMKQQSTHNTTQHEKHEVAQVTRYEPSERCHWQCVTQPLLELSAERRSMMQQHKQTSQCNSTMTTIGAGLDA